MRLVKLRLGEPSYIEGTVQNLGLDSVMDLITGLDNWTMKFNCQGSKVTCKLLSEVSMFLDDSVIVPRLSPRTMTMKGTRLP